MRRGLGLVYGIAAQVLFLATVPALYRFLHNDFAANPPRAAWINGLLAAQFCVLHSLLLWNPVRQRIGTLIQRPFYGAFYCIVTCLSLWVMFGCWRGSAHVVVQWPASLHGLVRAAFLLSWAALFYSLALTGLGYQTGLTPWWRWVRRRPLPARRFEPKGAYRWIRHPVYLSFLGLVWFTPIVTADRALLIVLWTTYIVAGSRFKDLRMTQFIGEPYRYYRSTIPGFVPNPRVVYAPQDVPGAPAAGVSQQSSPPSGDTPRLAA